MVVDVVISDAAGTGPEGDGRTFVRGVLVCQVAPAEHFRRQGLYVWAYSQDSGEPYDAEFRPRRPSAA
jgi:hypothetical protein